MNYQTITIKIPRGELTLKKNDVEFMHEKLTFFSEVIPILVCPEFYDHSDLFFNKDQCIEHLKDFAQENQDSILLELFKFMEEKKCLK